MKLKQLMPFLIQERAITRWVFEEDDDDGIKIIIRVKLCE